MALCQRALAGRQPLSWARNRLRATAVCERPVGATRSVTQPLARRRIRGNNAVTDSHEGHSYRWRGQADTPALCFNPTVVWDDRKETGWTTRFTSPPAISGLSSATLFRRTLP